MEGGEKRAMREGSERGRRERQREEEEWIWIRKEILKGQSWKFEAKLRERDEPTHTLIEFSESTL